MLTWASLLVAVLYSPLGSPELYKEVNPVTYQGVNFSNRDIANASKTIKQAGNNSNGISIPDNNQQPGNSTYKVSGATTNNNSGSYSSRPEDNFSSNQSSQSGEVNGQFGSVSGGKSSDRSTGSLMGSQNLSLNSDLSSVNNNNTSQGANLDGPLDGTTDPGGDPTGAPIPVGDGWVFLILLSGAYFAAKKFFYSAK